MIDDEPEPDPLARAVDEHRQIPRDVVPRVPAPADGLDEIPTGAQLVTWSEVDTVDVGGLVFGDDTTFSVPVGVTSHSETVEVLPPYTRQENPDD